MKHGFFARHYTADEKRLLKLIKHGDLKELIALEYIRLHRALELHRRQQENPDNALELDSIEVGTGPPPGTPGEGQQGRRYAKRVRKARDWYGEIGRCERRIKDMELAQKALMGTGRSPEEIGQAIRDTLAAAAAFTGPGMPGEDTGEQGDGTEPGEDGDSDGDTPGGWDKDPDA